MNRRDKITGRFLRTDLLERFESCYVKIDSGCWQWVKGGRGLGYGSLSYLGVNYDAHRVALFLYKKIPLRTPKLVADHICFNRACVNPAHLEMVTYRENVLRAPTSLSAINKSKTQCKNGHPFSGPNLRIVTNKKGYSHRECRECERLYNIKYRKQIKEKQNARK